MGEINILNKKDECMVGGRVSRVKVDVCHHINHELLNQIGL